MYEGRADQYDDVLNQFYAKARMYDAENKRFTQEDSARDDTNWYAYCGNDPLNYVDSLGLTTYGVGVSASAAFLLRVEIGGAVVWDDKGNSGLMLSPGVGVGTPAVGTGGTITITAADTIYDLKEWGGFAGISASPKYYP